MTTRQIKTAAQTDVDRCIAEIVLAFSGDPGVRWMYPDPHQYKGRRIAASAGECQLRETPSPYRSISGDENSVLSFQNVHFGDIYHIKQDG